MTQRELPTSKVPPATTMDAPTVSISTGSWHTGIDTQIPGVTLAALREAYGWTTETVDYAPDVLEINGRRRPLLDAIDDGNV